MAPSLQAVSHATSYRTAIDLFYDDTNHTIMFILRYYVDENSVLYA